MLGKVLEADIVEMIEGKQFSDLKSAFAEMSAADIGEIVSEMKPERAAVVFRVLPNSVAGEVFACLALSKQTELIQALADEGVAALLDSMPPDDRTRLLEELPGEVTRRLVAELSPEQRKIAQRLLGYKEGSIGRLMTPNYIMVQPAWTAAQALDQVRMSYRTAETANVIYVVDENLRLIDDLQLVQVVAARQDQPIAELMDRQFIALSADEDRESAVAVFQKHHRVALPVTDTSGVLVGIITLDDVLEVAEEEATEDIHKLGGMEALDEPYMTTPFWTLIRKRAGWLLLLFLGEMLTATAMGRFEEEISRAVVLALFIPLIISSGGNSGSQAASLIIRALAVGEVRIRDWWRIMWRELMSGLILGLTLGFVGFLRISVWSSFSDMYGPHWLLVAFTIWMALIGVVMWGTITGSMFPLILKRIGMDPAVSSAPFVATLVDVTGIVIYFEIAALVLRGTLL